jgi:hypothetical protein
MGLTMSRPDLDELETLTPPEGMPDDALVTVTIGDLRALVACIPAAKEVAALFGTHLQEARHGNG